MDLLFGLVFEKNDWAQKPLIWASYGELKRQLGIRLESSRVSFAQLAANESLGSLVAKTQEKQRREANPTASRVETETLQLAGRMNVFRSLVSGEALTIVPHPTDPEGTWVTPMEANVYYSPETSRRLLEEFVALGKAYVAKDNGALRQTGQTLGDDLRSLGSKVYPGQAALARESFYNHFRPFRKAWIAYLVAFLFGLGTLRSKKPAVYWSFVGLCFVGISLHIMGFVLRCWIADRPPVTNMYESVVWVSFGAMLFATILELIFRPKLYLLSACAIAVLGLILADNLPSVLNPSIQPLVPVLRSNYWLTVHVLTITLGYAAFALSLGVGHVVMGAYLFKPSAKALHTSLTNYLYRALQIGVLFLAAGTILGGVWANDSWGRFWGWDPKETWALIALLGYLVVLHGRFAGWMGNFALAVASVLCFQGVVMAWYGVNFVLGKGLHSYGFGTGGLPYVLTFVGLELLFVAVAAVRYKKIGSRKTRIELAETPAVPSV
jgi:ABC-type transport system involved in cytochrome c biogenesis permease subunit